jgi:hypothetical protein
MVNNKEMNKCLEKIAKEFAKKSSTEFGKELLEYEELKLCPEGYGPLPEQDHTRKFQIRGINPQDQKTISFGVLNMHVRYCSVSGWRYYSELPESRSYVFNFDESLRNRFPNLKRITLER